MPSILTVKQLNTYVRSLIEGDNRLFNISVCGEISNFKNHYSSGHLYFSLKDNDALIRCVMFRANAAGLKFIPSDGMKVVCKGRVSLYEKDGQYQFYAESLDMAGEGDLNAKFEEIKARLEKEGLFSRENKKELPSFPQNIAVVTSDTGAAVQDIINIISRRYPMCKIILCPVPVQGVGAADIICNTLEKIYRKVSADIIILGRGGGSAEDLWEFNNERLARTVAASPIPVISAVGHETDFTICDFVADLRAPTPSAAAEIAVPDIVELFARINSASLRLKNLMGNAVLTAESRINKAMQSIFLLKPERMLEDRMLNVDSAAHRLKESIKRIISEKDRQFSLTTARLEAANPLNVLSRGYSVVTVKDKAVRSIDEISVGDDIDITLTGGKAKCHVTSINKEK